ncbi:MAG: hypothetical protein OJF55_002846 [Rhodanobacteraceae bacterium]|jgi:HK97 family phage major capsid protein|nr:MAG: hypothetical protein OJF55_002846 [Rhodanobacteraceae bacterium]
MQQDADPEYMKARAMAEHAMARAGYTRSQRREMIAELRAEGLAQSNSEGNSMNEQTDANEIKPLLEEMSNAIADFKAKHQSEVAALRKGLDEHAVQLAARQMYGDGRAPAVPEGTPPLAAANVQRITAHYAKRAAEKHEPQGANLADMFRATAGLKPHNPAIMASLSEGTDSAGGYNVPSTVMPRILNAMVPMSSLLSAGAQVIPMDQGAKSSTQAAIDTLPTAAWRNELGTITESQPSFRAVTATPRSLACIIRVSRELLADAPDMDRALRDVMAQAFALELDRVGLVGSGTAPEPLGLANTAGVNAVSNGTNGAKLADYSNILSGIEAILGANGPLPTAAIMAPRTLVDFSGLADTLGQPLNKPSLVSPMQFLQTSQVGITDTVGTSTDCSRIYIGDFSRCAFVMREALSLQVLREAYAKTGELAFLAHVRGDFVVQYPKAFAIVSGVRAAA